MLAPVIILLSKYINNVSEQDHRGIRRHIRCMLDFKSETAARNTLTGIEFVHMMRNQQTNLASAKTSSLSQQFVKLTAQLGAEEYGVPSNSDFTTDPFLDVEKRVAYLKLIFNDPSVLHVFGVEHSAFCL